MSSQQTSASFSYTSTSSSSSINGQSSGVRSVEQVSSDPSGTTVRTAHQNLGEAPVEQIRHYDQQGRETIGGTGGGNASRRIEDVTDAEQERRDREYEERIEDEYAKREGGA